MDPLTNFVHRLLEPLSSWLSLGDPGGVWRSAAEAAGLTRIQTTRFLWMTTSLEGWLGPLHVDFQQASNRRGPPKVRITVTGLARAVSLRAENIGSRIQKRLGLQDDIETGDELFDADFLIQGHAPLIHALLDADTRGAVRRLFTLDETAALAAGELAGEFGQSETRFDDALARILDVAQRCVEPDDVASRLSRNALEDRLDGVRRRCLLRLVASHRDHATTIETLRRACKDPSEDVRLEAALTLQDEGEPVLRALAAAEGESCAVHAITALSARLDAMEALSLLELSFERRRGKVATALIETLGRSEPATVAAALEPLLIGRALVYPDETVRSAAAAALARMGTVAAVLPLQEAAQGAGGALRRALQDATRAIQSRLSGAERGQLTVSSVEGGTVTLAAEGGQVSLPDTDGSHRD